MTDKEFKRLNRSQLIDIIYQYQVKQEELLAEHEKLSQELEDRRLRISETGNMAEAALAVHNVFQTAQAAADHYLEELRQRGNEEHQRLLKQAEAEAADIKAAAATEAAALIANAEKEAAELIAQAKNGKLNRMPGETAVTEKQNHTKNS